jgi:hypothetical protein
MKFKNSNTAPRPLSSVSRGLAVVKNAGCASRRAILSKKARLASRSLSAIHLGRSPQMQIEGLQLREAEGPS